MIYELRVYQPVPGRMPALLARFRDQTVAIWEKHGIRAVGFWTTLIGESSSELTYMLVQLDRDYGSQSPSDPWPQWYARALVECGHAKSVKDAFDRFLHSGGPLWVDRRRLRSGVGCHRSACAVVEQCPDDVHRAHPVDHRVVPADEHRRAATGRSLQQDMAPPSYLPIRPVDFLIPSSDSPANSDSRTRSGCLASRTIKSPWPAGVLK